ncbi:MAG: transaldolase family protein [Candidatus Rhabdochlamydia sp.]
MQFWIETINASLIEAGAKTGLIQAVVLPPALLLKEENPLKMIQQMLDIQPGYVVIDVLSHFEEMGYKLAALSKRLILRMPVKEDALHAMAKLSCNQIKVMAGGVFSLHQALLAAKAGASYISAHFLRMAKMGDSSFEQLQAIQTVLTQSYPQTAIIALHPKTAEQIKECAKLLIHGAILREDCYQELLETHEMTLFHIEQQEEEWAHFRTQLELLPPV